MSEENVEIVRKWYERVVATLELPPELHTSDFELDGSDVQASVVRGIKAGEGLLRPYWETFDDFHIDIEEVIRADEECVVDVVRDGGASEEAMPRFRIASSTFSPSVVTRSHASQSTPTGIAPSKPPGGGSRRCRRKT